MLSALVAFAPVRLSVLNAKKTSACVRGSLFAIVDNRLPIIQQKRLCDLGFSIIPLEADKRLPEPMSSHTDMLLFAHNNTIIVSSSYLSEHEQTAKKILSSAKGYNIIEANIKFGKEYPHDAVFNALTIGQHLFCKSDTVAEDIINYANQNGLKIISVKQGYPACTTLAIGENFAVTSDMGMARALTKEGISVMTVPECEKILLPPYKNGFIGGSFAVCKNKVFAFGNAKVLPYYDKLSKELSKMNYEIVSLDESSDSLLDLGKAVFVEKRI